MRSQGTASTQLLVLALIVCSCAGARDGGSVMNLEEDDTPVTAATEETNTVESELVEYQGLDVSHFQGSVDWPEVLATGYRFAFAKATEGTDYVDPMFATNWQGMKAAGVVRGAYHFFRAEDDAAAQAELFIATVTLEAGDLPPALDIEIADGVSTEGIDQEITIWLEKVAAAYGVTPIIYSDHTFINANLATGFSDYPLWLAEYEEAQADAPDGWNSWTFWQSSQSGKVAGVEGAVDLDTYSGSAQAWAELRVPQAQ